MDKESAGAFSSLHPKNENGQTVGVDHASLYIAPHLSTCPHHKSHRLHILSQREAMKRERESSARLELANRLMLLSHEQREAEFECKTCKRKFSSFQALGGHRASHKRPKLEGGEEDLKAEAKSLKLGNKPRMHECSICGVEFSLGQALGGHMRKHKVHALKKSNSSRRVFCLDLNLTPLQNDLNLLLANMPPALT